METRKKQIKTMIVTIFALLLISVMVAPETNGRYIKEGDALAYRADLYSLYAGYFENSIDVIPSLSTPSDIYFEFLFGHNKATSEVDSDKYQVSIPEGCTLDLENIRPSTRFDGVDTFTFIPKLDYVNDYYTIVGMSCPVDAIKDDEDNLKVDVTIVEQATINGVTGTTFKFIDLNYQDTLENYLNTINPVPPVIDIPEIDKDGVEVDIYEEFMKWITNYATLSPYKTDILSYAELVTRENILNDPFPLRGITRTLTDGVYTFVMDDSFIGYARTHSHHTSSLGTYMYFTFEDKESDAINDAFLYYLETYVYDSSEAEEYLKIKDFVLNMTDQVGFKTLLSGGSIPGFRYFPEDDKVLMYSRVLDFIGININNYFVKINYGTALEMNRSYQESLTAFNTLHDILSNDGLDYVSKSFTRLKNSVFTNNDTENYQGYHDPKISFTDYHVYYDTEKGHYVFFRVSSDVGENIDTNYNLITFDTYKANADHKIVFQNKEEDGKNVLVMQIKDADNARVEETMEFLKEYFGEDITFTTAEKDGQFIATAKIEKKIISNITIEETPEENPEENQETNEENPEEIKTNEKEF